MKKRHDFTPITVSGIRLLALSKKVTIRLIGGVRLVQRMLYATRHKLCEKPWLRIARWKEPGRDLLIDTSSAEDAYARLLAGEQPPLLPSEAKCQRKNLACYCGILDGSGNYRPCHADVLLEVANRKEPNA